MRDFTKILKHSDRRWRVRSGKMVGNGGHDKETRRSIGITDVLRRNAKFYESSDEHTSVADEFVRVKWWMTTKKRKRSVGVTDVLRQGGQPTLDGSLYDDALPNTFYFVLNIKHITCYLWYNLHWIKRVNITKYIDNTTEYVRLGQVTNLVLLYHLFPLFTSTILWSLIFGHVYNVYIIFLCEQLTLLEYMQCLFPWSLKV